MTIRVSVAVISALVLTLATVGQIAASPPMIPTPTPLPQPPIPTPLPTPTPCVCDPNYPLTDTIEVTNSELYYQGVAQIDTTFAAVSSTVGQGIGGLSGLMGMVGLTPPGEKEGKSGDQTAYAGYSMLELTTEIISNTDQAFLWFRAVGEISIMGTSVQFLLASLAFILIVILIKVIIKIILFLIDLGIRIIQGLLIFVPFL